MKALAKTDQEAVKQAVLDYEVLDQTASAKLIAAWGIDYGTITLSGGQLKKLQKNELK
jgi:hypothetical protein